MRVLELIEHGILSATDNLELLLSEAFYYAERAHRFWKVGNKEFFEFCNEVPRPTLMPSYF